MNGALGEIDHVSGRVNGQRMLGKAGPWGDIACHFPSQPELFIRCCRKQGNHQILQCDDTDTQRHEFGIGQIRDSIRSVSSAEFVAGPSGPAPPSLSHLDRAR